MPHQLLTIAPFTVTGIAVRTINADEFTTDQAKLPALWGRFFSEGVVTKVENRLPDSPVYGVYSDYESDATGYYSVTAGVASSGPDVAEFTSIDVHGGQYLVFKNQGPMPQAVIGAWNQVWAFFEPGNAQNEGYGRRFDTDFEQYQGDDEVAIYIGIIA